MSTKNGLKPDALVVIALSKAIFKPSKEQGICFILKPARVAI